MTKLTAPIAFLTNLAAAMGLLLLAAPAEADVVLLKNGKILEGRVEELASGKVRIHLAAGSLTFPQSQIASVEAAQTLEEILEGELRRLAPDDAEGRFRLAQRARREQESTLSSRLLEEVISVDPDHERARSLLGYVAHEGSWLTKEQFHTLRGEVQFQGRWVPASVRDSMLRQQAERRALAQEMQLQLAAERAAAARQRAQAEAEEAAERERIAIQQRAAFATPGYLVPGCSGSYFPGSGYSGLGFGGAGFQTLPPFQPGLIQVPRQSYHYSFHQIHRSRAPAPRPLPRDGYRRHPQPHHPGR